MTSALVGTIMFVNPSPNWNARTAVCCGTPVSVASGDMIGIVTKACPDPDGMKKLQTDWTSSMPMAETSAGMPSSSPAIEYTIVSMIWPSSSTMAMARAKPTIRAGAVIFAAPSRNVRLVSPGDMRAIAAATSPMPKNNAFSSSMYQLKFAAP